MFAIIAVLCIATVANAHVVIIDRSVSGTVETRCIGDGNSLRYRLQHNDMEPLADNHSNQNVTIAAGNCLYRSVNGGDESSEDCREGTGCVVFGDFSKHITTHLHQCHHSSISVYVVGPHRYKGMSVRVPPHVIGVEVHGLNSPTVHIGEGRSLLTLDRQSPRSGKTLREDEPNIQPSRINNLSVRGVVFVGDGIVVGHGGRVVDSLLFSNVDFIGVAPRDPSVVISAMFVDGCSTNQTKTHSLIGVSKYTMRNCKVHITQPIRILYRIGCSSGLVMTNNSFHLTGNHAFKSHYLYHKNCSHPTGDSESGASPSTLPENGDVQIVEHYNSVVSGEHFHGEPNTRSFHFANNKVECRYGVGGCPGLVQLVSPKRNNMDPTDAGIWRIVVEHNHMHCLRNRAIKSLVSVGGFDQRTNTVAHSNLFDCSIANVISVRSKVNQCHDSSSYHLYKNRFRSVHRLLFAWNVAPRLFVAYRNTVFSVRRQLVTLSHTHCDRVACESMIRLWENAFHKSNAGMQNDGFGASFDFVSDVVRGDSTRKIPQHCGFDANGNYWGSYNSELVSRILSQNVYDYYGRHAIDTLLRDVCPSTIKHMPQCQYSYMYGPAVIEWFLSIVRNDPFVIDGASFELAAVVFVVIDVAVLLGSLLAVVLVTGNTQP
jgi:hypothetical protein